MAAKTITITEDAYHSIVRLKKGTESFSELFTRIGGEHRSIRDLFGILKHDAKESSEFKRRMRWIREDLGKAMGN